MFCPPVVWIAILFTSLYLYLSFEFIADPRDLAQGDQTSVVLGLRTAHALGYLIPSFTHHVILLSPLFHFFPQHIPTRERKGRPFSCEAHATCLTKSQPCSIISDVFMRMSP
jgi:hypothetical protein